MTMILWEETTVLEWMTVRTRQWVQVSNPAPLLVVKSWEMLQLEGVRPRKSVFPEVEEKLILGMAVQGEVQS